MAARTNCDAMNEKRICYALAIIRIFEWKVNAGESAQGPLVAQLLEGEQEGGEIEDDIGRAAGK